MLIWKTPIDIESGLSGFEILRDGKVIAKIPEKPTGKFGRALYQPMSYHDTPEKGSPGLKTDTLLFTFSELMQNGNPQYQVKAINSAGLESELSKPTVDSSDKDKVK